MASQTPSASISAKQPAWPRRVTYALLAAFTVLAIILRYPTTSQEIGVDSYSIHALSNLIASTGRIGWLVSPLSYLGLAPFSYSPAVPISLAEFESLAGMSGESAVLVYSLFLGAILPLTAFLLGFAAFRKPSMGLIVSFLISTAEGMVGFTAFTVSTRGAFLVLVPLALALFIDVLLRGSRGWNSGIGLISVLATLLLVHAMFLLLVPLLVAAYVAYRVVLLEDRLLSHRMNSYQRVRVATATTVSVGIILALLIGFGSASETLTGFPVLQTTLIPDNLVTRMGVQWATLMGLGVVLLPVGLVRVPRMIDRRKSYLLLALALTFLPLALNPVYGVLIATPIALLVAGLGILPSGLSRRTKKPHSWTTPVVLTVAIGAAIIVAPIIVTIPRTSGVPCNEPDIINSQTYNVGLYLRYNAPENSSFVWDDHIEAERLEAISGVPSLEPILSIGDLEYPWLAAKMNVKFSSNTNLADFFLSGHQLLEAQEWLPAAGLDYSYYWGKHTFVLLQSTPGSTTANQILEFYHASLAIQRCGTSQNTFYGGLDSSNYILYADELQRAYWIRGYP